MPPAVHFPFSRRIARILVALTLAFTVLAPTIVVAKEAAVPRKYAGIVVDAKSGKVLYESAADAARYPASVTKVMTLYVLFQELSAGNLKLTSKMKVSKHAAAAVPTKLGIKSGSSISVEDAIKALVTLSANDIARVIAEHISGTESEFAKRMTSTARALGMAHTTYANASGLPDKRQVTTVRDQAVLGVAVYQHFPKYYDYFQTKSFAWGKRVYGNHNRLLGANGVDGIKTGYINASGFNLLTAARSNNRHIVVVGFGFDSSSARDSKVRELVKSYLPKGRQGDYTQTAMIPVPGRKGAAVMTASADPVPVIPMPYPSFRLKGATPAPVQTLTAAISEAPAMDVAPAPMTMVAAGLSAPVPAPRPTDLGMQPALAAATALADPNYGQDRPLDVIGAWLSETFSLGAPPAALGQTPPSAPLLPPVGIGSGGEALDLSTSGSVSRVAEIAPVAPAPAAVVAAPTPSASGGWVVQIGATPTETGAHGLLGDASSRVGALASFRPYVERFEKNGQTFYRARFGGFGARADATGMCNELKKINVSCLAMQS